MPSRLGSLLAMKTTSLEKVIYFQDYVVIDPGDTPLKAQQLLTEEEYRTAREQYGETRSRPTWAPRRSSKLLEKLDLVEAVASSSASELARKPARKQKAKDLVKRLKTVEAIRDSRQQAASGWCWSASR